MVKGILTIPLWEGREGLVHGCTMREVGNLSYRSAGKDEAGAGRVRLAEGLGIDPGRMFSIPLRHTNRVVVLRDDSFLRRLDARGYLRANPEEIIGWPVLAPEPYADMPTDKEYVDGVVFGATDVYSLIITADCAAVAFYDPVREVCGNAHVGLVGAINQLAKAMPAVMGESFGCRARDIEAVIFPCIRACHYNTANSMTWQKIKGRVREEYGADNPLYASGYFDLPGFIRGQLLEAGLRAEHIVDSGICTVCRKDKFFSHVGAGTAEAQEREGRFGAVVGMRRGRG